MFNSDLFASIESSIFPQGQKAAFWAVYQAFSMFLAMSHYLHQELFNFIKFLINYLDFEPKNIFSWLTTGYI